MGDRILAYHNGDVPSTSGLTHKVDPDKPVSNRIAVVQRMLEPLFKNPYKKIVLIRNTKIIDEPDVSFESLSGEVLEAVARRSSGSNECAPPPRKRGRAQPRRSPG